MGTIAQRESRDMNSFAQLRVIQSKLLALSGYALIEEQRAIQVEHT
jgi:hypothetical protein